MRRITAAGFNAARVPARKPVVAAVEPAGLKLKPRKIALALSANMPRYWFDNHPFKTHYFNALSSIFPVGERFFVRSVRYYLGEMTNASLRNKVKDFVRQEGHHSIEHDAHIKLLLEQGYVRVRFYERCDKAILDYLNRHFPRFSLAATVALEHFTAIMSNELMSHQKRWIDPMHEDMRRLWRWHCVEEIEHKAVAYDVYQEVCGSYGLRISAMVLETVGLLLDSLLRTAYFLWKDGLFWRPRIWWQGIGFVWGRQGAMRSVLRDYFRFYRRDFHPWKHNNYHLVEELWGGQMHILIVEDDLKTVAYLRKGLSEQGYTVDVAEDGEEGLHLALSGDYDLLILDIMLPRRDGWSVLANLRRGGRQTPVLMLTARDAVAERVRGLELGADDYLIKPFAFSELLARIRTVLRRGSETRLETLRIADLELDLRRQQVVRAGERLILTPQEFRLLSYFIQHVGEVLSRTLLAEQVWGMNFDSDTNIVDVAVRRLRRKVDSQFDSKLIHTVRGMGYVFEEH